jgi:phenylalanine-4-hydroxylase
LAYRSQIKASSEQELVKRAIYIDSYQQSYFVIDSFEQLFDLTEPDFAPLYAQLKDIKVIDPGARHIEDILILI